MRKLGFVGLFTLLSLALVFAACGKQAGGGTTSTPSAPANTIGMGSSTFDQKSITVTANTPVHFADTTNGGGTHIVCVAAGTSYSTTCETSGDAPQELLGSGTTFNAGDKKDITFTKAGTYNVVCTVHPGMQIIVTVQ